MAGWRRTFSRCVVCAALLCMPLSAVRAQVTVPLTEPAPTSQPVTASVAVEPTTPPAATPREIQRPEVAGPTSSSTSSPATALYEVGRVIGSLALVLALIVLLKFGAGKFFGIRSASSAANKGIRVISRTVIHPKQQFLLLQVGRKLVLVADSAGTVSPVCEITDPDEVAELSAQALSRPDKATNTVFSKLFQRQSSQLEQEGSDLSQRSRYDDDVDMMDDPAELDQPSRDRDYHLATSRLDQQSESSELEGLASRIRSLGQQFSSR